MRIRALDMDPITLPKDPNHVGPATLPLDHFCSNFFLLTACASGWRRWLKLFAVGQERALGDSAEMVSPLLASAAGAAKSQSAASDSRRQHPHRLESVNDCFWLSWCFFGLTVSFLIWGVLQVCTCLCTYILGVLVYLL
jgi:hypothetical protein